MFIKRGASNEEGSTDLEHAWVCAEALVGYARAPALMQFLAGEATVLLLAARVKLERPAEALLAQRTLSAAAVAEVLRAYEPRS